MNHSTISTLTARDISLIEELEDRMELSALFDDERAVLIKLLALYEADEILNSLIRFDTPEQVINYFSRSYQYMSSQSIIEELFNTDIVKYGIDRFLNRLDRAILPKDLTAASVYEIFNL